MKIMKTRKTQKALGMLAVLAALLGCGTQDATSKSNKAAQPSSGPAIGQTVEPAPVQPVAVETQGASAGAGTLTPAPSPTVAAVPAPAPVVTPAPAPQPQVIPQLPNAPTTPVPASNVIVKGTSGGPLAGNTLNVTVIDLATFQPLSGATVWLAHDPNHPMTTGASGKAAFPGQSGPVTVSAAHGKDYTMETFVGVRVTEVRMALAKFQASPPSVAEATIAISVGGLVSWFESVQLTADCSDEDGMEAPLGSSLLHVTEMLNALKPSADLRVVAGGRYDLSLMVLDGLSGSLTKGVIRHGILAPAAGLRIDLVMDAALFPPARTLVGGKMVLPAGFGGIIVPTSVKDIADFDEDYQGPAMNFVGSVQLKGDGLPCGQIKASGQGASRDYELTTITDEPQEFKLGLWTPSQDLGAIFYSASDVLPLGATLPTVTLRNAPLPISPAGPGGLGALSAIQWTNNGSLGSGAGYWSMDIVGGNEDEVRVWMIYAPQDITAVTLPALPSGMVGFEANGVMVQAIQRPGVDFQAADFGLLDDAAQAQGWSFFGISKTMTP